MNKEEFIKIFEEALETEEYKAQIKDEIEVKILQTKSLVRKSAKEMEIDLDEDEILHATISIIVLQMGKVASYLRKELEEENK